MTAYAANLQGRCIFFAIIRIFDPVTFAVLFVLIYTAQVKVSLELYRVDVASYHHIEIILSE